MQKKTRNIIIILLSLVVVSILFGYEKETQYCTICFKFRNRCNLVFGETAFLTLYSHEGNDPLSDFLATKIYQGHSHSWKFGSGQIIGGISGGFYDSSFPLDMIHGSGYLKKDDLPIILGNILEWEGNDNGKQIILRIIEGLRSGFTYSHLLKGTADDIGRAISDLLDIGPDKSLWGKWWTDNKWMFDEVSAPYSKTPDEPAKNKLVDGK
ncbi:MAG: hypothetical protein V1709_08250 [Planctomycetota bacterium]